MLARGVGMTTTALSGPIDVHMVTHEQARQGRRHPPPVDDLTARRRIAGFAVAAAGLPLATVLLTSLRGQLTLASDILTVMVVVVAAAIVGGFWPGVAAALAGFLLLNYYFTQPYHTFVISRPDEVLALVVFVVVAAAVSAVVGLAARRTRDAARSGADAEVLFNLAGHVLRGEHALDALLDRLRETFGQESVTLLEHRPGTALTPARQHDPASWQVAATVGGKPCAAPDEGDTDIPVGEDLALVLRGRPCRPPTGASWKPSPPRRPLRCASSGWPKRPNVPASWSKPVGCALPCCRRSAMTCAPRSARPWWPSRAWPTLISPGPATSTPNWWRRPGNPSSGSTAWSPTCWT